MQQFDVFLCHNSEDKHAVKEVAEILRDNGLNPWLDEWELRPGIPWQRVLEEQIRQNKSVAVFVGEAGIGPWQQLEQEGFIREFVKRKCPVIPVILPSCTNKPELPVFLDGFGWVDFRKAAPDPTQSLIWGITGKRPYPDPEGSATGVAVDVVDPADPLKGPSAFTPAEADLFWRLGRQKELNKLFGYVTDDQISIVVVVGASGSGKTSLLRAGLAHILRESDVASHYWEATPTTPEKSLLHAVRKTWNSSNSLPESLEDIANADDRSRVIVLDQFEQLAGRSYRSCPVFRLLRQIARKRHPPHSTTWIVAFRREFRADWSDFFIPEQERGFYPSEISIKSFSLEQAKEVTKTLLDEAGIVAQDLVLNDLVEASRDSEGTISPVDIGIGNLMLSELNRQHPGRTINRRMYRFAGGAEGLLELYARDQIHRAAHSPAERSKLLGSLLELRDPDRHRQRLADGLSLTDVARRTKTSESQLKTQFEYLQQPNVRILEKLSSGENNSDVKYRLTHERLVQSLNTLAGLLLENVKQVRLRLDAAFQAWENNDRQPAYLLKGKDLRLVARHFHQLALVKQRADKYEFLSKSRRARRLRRIYTWSILCVIAIMVGGSWREYRFSTARRIVQQFDGTNSIAEVEQLSNMGQFAERALVELIQEPTRTQNLDEHLAAMKRKSDAVIAMIQFGNFDSLLGAFSVQNDPELLTQSVLRSKLLGTQLAQHLDFFDYVNNRRRDESGGNELLLFAALLTLGEFELSNLSTKRFDSLVRDLEWLYQFDPSSAIHSATRWLLFNKLKRFKNVTEIDTAVAVTTIPTNLQGPVKK